MKVESKFIYFGRYPQSRCVEVNPSNKTISIGEEMFLLEPIKWRVLKKCENKALLFSEYILDTQIFNKDTNEYEISNIRNWLNNDFLDIAFTKEEQEEILRTHQENKENRDNPLFSSDIDLNRNPTNDKIFLLSIEDITNEDYGFPSHQGETATRIKKPTKYAETQGAENWYYLRTPSSIYPYSVAVITEEGDIFWDNVSHNGCGIAMAMWVKL